MHNRLFITFVQMLLFTSVASAQPEIKVWDVSLSGEYIGQQRPGMSPVIFASFLAGPNDHKHGSPVFTMDGRQVFYPVYFDNKPPQITMHSRVIEDHWAEPTIAWYTGVYQEGAPVFTPDGDRFYFGSKRPLEFNGGQRKHWDIWCIDRTESGWGAPRNLGKPINTDNDERPLCVFPDGSLLISTEKDNRPHDLKVCRMVDGELQIPEILDVQRPTPGAPIFDAALSPDGSVLVYTIVNEARNGTSMHVCDRLDDGWSRPRRLNDQFNRGGARFPSFSPDGRFFFFTSNRTGAEEIYWVDASALDPMTENHE